ncbi:MAG TPA: RNA polymerase sigma factor [Thermoanaerobaculia bacterium]|nr:RNA polymerase sigma factor [Thermoanaerobaculia bacterium]
MIEPLLQAEPAGPDAPASDAELMALVRQGDRDAFTQLIDRHKDAVVGYLARLTGSRDRAEDLGQDTFLRLFRSAAGYVEQGYLRAFLFRIATNLAHSEERRERRLRLLAPFLLGSRHSEAAEAAAPAGLLRAEVQREVTAAIAALPMSYRVPLVLHELEGWAYADIARELSCREGTVKSRIHRGRERLRRSLEPYWHGGVAWKTSE